MKNKLKNAFKETPERFSYVIDDALRQAHLKKTKKRISTPLKFVIAVVLIFAILPSAVFGAAKLYGAVAHRVGNFGVTFDISINEDSPEYVKMNIDVPDGFKEVPNTEGLKYNRDNDEYGFSIFPMRFYENVDHTALETDVKEYKEVIIASRPSYELMGTDDYQGLRRYYVWYEEANVMVLIYRGETVTDSELEAFADAISFTEGTKADNDIFFEPETVETETTGEGELPEYEFVFKEMPLESEIVLTAWEDEAQAEVEYKAKITDVRVTDDINGLDESCINSMYDLSEVADANGNLLPRTVEVWQDGDGVNTESKLLSTEAKEQSMVLVDVEFTNTADSEIQIFVPYMFETLVKDEKGNYSYSSSIDKAQNIFANSYCDNTEIFYMSYHGETEKEFYMPKLQPNETRTITLGFRCIKEQLSNAYISLRCEGSAIVEPVIQYKPFRETYLIFKVQ